MALSTLDLPPSLLPADLEDALEHGPFHQALQIAITNSGLALSRLEYHLEQRGFRVGRSTLSYWQQGRRRPERADSMEALTALEDILHVPSGSLMALLGPRKPRGRWISHQTGTVGWADMWGASEDIKRLVVSDSRSNADKFRSMTIMERFEIGADKRMQRLRIQEATRAHEAGADRSVLVHNADPDLDVSRIQLTDLDNCRVGRTRVLEDANFLAYELLFDHSLLEGETYLFGYTVDLSQAYLSSAELAERGIERVVATDGQRSLRRATHSYVLEARFDPAALPVRCFHVQSARVGDQQREIAELHLNAHHAAHVAMQNVPPGVHGMRWEWE